MGCSNMCCFLCEARDATRACEKGKRVLDERPGTVQCQPLCLVWSWNTASVNSMFGTQTRFKVTDQPKETVFSSTLNASSSIHLYINHVVMYSLEYPVLGNILLTLVYVNKLCTCVFNISLYNDPVTLIFFLHRQSHYQSPICILHLLKLSSH